MIHTERRPSTWRILKALGWTTFLEIVRDKVLYNIILCAFLLLGLGFLASKLIFLQPERVMLDFGLSGTAISCLMIAIFTGSSLLGREFERRTICLALCHPVSRAQFVLGKFSGLVLVIFVNWLLLSLSYLLILSGVSDWQAGCLSPILLTALVLVLIQSWMLAGLAILFSTFTTTSLSVVFSVGLYLIGNSVNQLRELSLKIQSSLGRWIIKGVADLLPDLQHFNMGMRVTYGLPIDWKFFGLSVLYGVTFTSVVLLFAGVLIQKREVT